MTVNVVRARAPRSDLDVRVPFGDLDTAVGFASWLSSRGYEIDIYDDNVLAIVHSPREAQQAQRLASLYACSLDSQVGA